VKTVRSSDFELVLVLGLGLGLAIVIVIVIVIVLDTRQQRGQRGGRQGLVAFDHEKLDLYRLAVLFSQLGGRAARSSKASNRIWTTTRK
jgi:hypothetical protein